MRRIRVVSRRTIYRGRIIRLDQEVLQVDGRRIIRETVHHPGAVEETGWRAGRLRRLTQFFAAPGVLVAEPVLRRR